MPEKHTVIVGGGVIGTCAAYYLARRGGRVTLLDKGEIASGASYGNAGLIALGHLPIPKPGMVRQAIRWMFDETSPLYIEPRLSLDLLRWLLHFRRVCRADRLMASMKVLSDLGHATSRLFDELINGEGLECDFHRRGYMEVFRTEAGLRHAERDAKLTREFGFEAVTLRGAELYDREPALAPTAVGAIWYPQNAHSKPQRVVQRLAERARGYSANLREQTEVADVTIDRGAAVGVRTADDETIEADTLVLASGAWTTRLAKRLGIRISMEPAKGYHRDVDRPLECIHTPCVLGEDKVAVTPIDDFLRLAGTLEMSGLNLDLRRERLEMLTAGAARYLPEVAELEPRSEWCGLRPCTPDGLPIIGWAPGVRDIFIATGHAMMGLAQGPITGKIVEECILDGQSSLDAEPLRASRFSS